MASMIQVSFFVFGKLQCICLTCLGLNIYIYIYTVQECEGLKNKLMQKKEAGASSSIID